MSKGLSKLWMYIVPLILLGVVATCEDDFSLGNPFSDKEVPEDSAEKDDTLKLAQQPKRDYGPESLLMDPGTFDIAAESKAKEPRVTQKKQWRLVIGSVKEKSRAEKMAERHHNPAIQVMYVEYLNTHRVVYESYGDIREAQQGFAEKHSQFPQAWLGYF